MMDREHARNEVVTFLKSIQEPRGIVDLPADNDPLVGASLADSMDLLTMITFLEDRFGIDFDSGTFDPNEINTLDGILNLIASQGGSSPSN